MKINVITLFPDLIRNYLNDAILGKAIQQKKIEVEVTSLREHTSGSYKSADETPFGGGDGMVIRPEVLEEALQSIRLRHPLSEPKVIYLSPQGKPWTHAAAAQLANSSQDYVFICGRYAGIDQRFIDRYVDEEISIGDYVLSGGELAALVVIESVSRLIPGVLGDHQSALEDSFAKDLLEAPQFTRPQVWHGVNVPAVLLSGHHQKIQEWKEMCGYLITLKKRPDLIKEKQIDLKKLSTFFHQLTTIDKKTLGIEDLEI